jgi:hypothetical protein
LLGDFPLANRRAQRKKPNARKIKERNSPSHIRFRTILASHARQPARGMMRNSPVPAKNLFIPAANKSVPAANMKDQSWNANVPDQNTCVPARNTKIIVENLLVPIGNEVVPGRLLLENDENGRFCAFQAGISRRWAEKKMTR